MTTIYQENFDDPNIAGKGAIGTNNGVEIDLTGVTWSVNVDDTNLLEDNKDWFNIQTENGNGYLEGKDLDGEAIWETSVINISGFTDVNFSLDAIEVGGHEATDYFDVYYQIDNGGFTRIENWNNLGDTNHSLVDDFTSTTITQNNLLGNSLQLRVVFRNSADNELLRLDNILVEGTSSGPDTTAPTATAFTPGDDATNVAVADNLSVTFNEDIKTGTGNILLKDAGGTTIETFDVATAGNLTISGSTLTIDPTSDLASSTGYYIEMANGAILDLADNAYTGISGATAWNFTTADVAAPEIATLTPADDTNNVGVGDVLSIQFDENILKGTGNILIKKVSDDSVFETIDITSFSVAVNNNTLVIDPASDLDSGTAYYIEIDATAVQDTAGNNFAGITGNATWNFTTAAPGAGDTTAPVATTFTPADDAININVADNLGILFNEDIQAGTGNIFLKDEQGTVVETFDVATSAQIQIVAGKGFVIDPTSDLNPATTYS